MSTARRCLKSPQSLSGTSTHPTMVAHRSRLWSWKIDLHPFCSMSICPPIPQIRLCQILPWNYKVKVMGVVIRAIPYSQPSIWFCFLLFHINQITIAEIQLFWNVTLKNQRSRSWVTSRSRSHNLPSIQPMHLLFISHQSDQPFFRYVQFSVWPKKTHSKF